MTYRLEQLRPGGELNFDRIQVLTDGGTRVRLSIGSGAEQAAVMVTDGGHSMTVNPSEHSFEADTASLPAFVVAATGRR